MFSRDACECAPCVIKWMVYPCMQKRSPEEAEVPLKHQLLQVIVRVLQYRMLLTGKAHVSSDLFTNPSCSFYEHADLLILYPTNTFKCLNIYILHYSPSFCAYIQPPSFFIFYLFRFQTTWTTSHLILKNMRTRKVKWAIDPYRRCLNVTECL